LEGIKAAWRAGEPNARDRLHDLRQDIEASRNSFADAFTEITSQVSDDDEVPQERLTEIIEKYADKLDEDTKSLFYEGVSSYMVRRRDLKNHLSKVGVEGLLGEVMEDNYNEIDEVDSAATPDFKGRLHNVALRATVEIGPVNYNIFISHDDFNMLDKPDENGVYKADKWGGFAKTDVRFPYSVIFGNGKMTGEQRLLYSIFCKDMHSSAERKTIAHENQHQIMHFVDYIMRGGDLYKSIAQAKNRIRSLSGFNGVDFLIDKDRKLLLKKLKMVPGMAKINSIEEVPSEFWQKLDKHKYVGRKMFEGITYQIKDELLAFMTDDKTDEQIKAILRDVYLPKYANQVKCHSEQADTNALIEEWQDQVDAAIKTIDELKSLGNTTEQVIAMLTPLELSQWAGVARKQKIAKRLGRTSIQPLTKND
jgi:hypothetical protein